MDAPHADLVLVSPYPPDRGRLSEHSQQLAEGLKARGLITEVLADVELSGQGSASNVKVTRAWKPGNPLSLLGIPFRILRSRPRLVLFNSHFAVFGRSKPTNFIGFLSIFLVCKLGWLFGYKTVVVLHSIPEAVDTQLYGLKPSFLNRLGLLLAEKFALSCDAVVVTMRMYQRVIEHRFGLPSYYIPHGAWVYPPPRDRPGKPRDSLLFLGYLHPGKDMEMLASAFRELKTRHPDLKLKLATVPHPNFPDSKSRLNVFKGMEGVEFLGFLTDDELSSVFGSSVALVLPYVSATGTSGVLHVVSAAGLPVVATDLIEFRQSQAEGAGLILAEDAGDIAHAVDRLIEDESYWNEVSMRSRRFGAGRSWDNVCSEFVSLFRMLWTSA